MGRLGCCLCLHVSKPQIIRLIYKKKKKKTLKFTDLLCGEWIVWFTVYVMTLEWVTGPRGDSMWKNFGLPCGTVKNKKGGQPLEKGIPSGKREKKKVCIIYTYMHEQLSMTNEIGGVLPLTWVIIIDLTNDQTNLSRL